MACLPPGSHDEDGAAGGLVPQVYDELRQLAAHFLRRERAGHTLQPTALVNEAWLRLEGAEGLGALDRSHFIGVAARVLRRVLVEHARGRGAAKRGGGARRVTLGTHLLAGGDPAGGGSDVDVLALDEALGRLAELDERQARVVELRFFAGLTVADVAQMLQLSKRSVELDWTLARAFLRRELEKGDV